MAAGLGILWAARDAGSVNADVARWQAQQARSPRARRLFELQARIAPATAVWFGRLFAALAFAGGVVLLLRG
jgi:hypothetical protein